MSHRHAEANVDSRKRKGYLGTFKVELDALSYDISQLKDAEELQKHYRMQVNYRLEPHNRVPVSIDRTRFQQHLDEAKLCQQRNDEHPVLKIPENTKLRCMRGAALIAAAKNYYQNTRDRWWIVELYDIAGDRSLENYLEDQHWQAERLNDGDVLLKAHGYAKLQLGLDRNHLLSTLAPTARKHFKVLSEKPVNADLHAALIKINSIPGMRPDLHLSVLNILFTTHCNEELTCYINHTFKIWLRIVGNRRAWLARIDVATVKALEGKAPMCSLVDRANLQFQMRKGEIFRGFDRDERREIMWRLETLPPEPIPTQGTFFSDAKHLLKPWVDCVKRLIPPLPRDSSLYEMLGMAFTKSDSIDIQIGERRFQSRRCTEDESERIAYLQLFMFAIRHWTEMPPKPVKKSSKAKTSVDGDQDILRAYADLANRLGYESEEIQRLLQLPETGIQDTMPRRATLVTSEMGPVPRHRSGAAAAESHEHDKAFIFWANFLEDDAEIPQDNDITSFFVLRSKFLAFFEYRIRGTEPKDPEDNVSLDGQDEEEFYEAPTGDHESVPQFPQSEPSPTTRVEEGEQPCSRNPLQNSPNVQRQSAPLNIHIFSGPTTSPRSTRPDGFDPRNDVSQPTVLIPEDPFIETNEVIDHSDHLMLDVPGNWPIGEDYITASNDGWAEPQIQPPTVPRDFSANTLQQKKHQSHQITQQNVYNEPAPSYAQAQDTESTKRQEDTNVAAPEDESHISINTIVDVQMLPMDTASNRQQLPSMEVVHPLTALEHERELPIAARSVPSCVETMNSAPACAGPEAVSESGPFCNDRDGSSVVRTPEVLPDAPIVGDSNMDETGEDKYPDDASPAYDDAPVVVDSNMDETSRDTCPDDALPTDDGTIEPGREGTKVFPSETTSEENVARALYLEHHPRINVREQNIGETSKDNSVANEPSACDSTEEQGEGDVTQEGGRDDVSTGHTIYGGWMLASRNGLVGSVQRRVRTATSGTLEPSGSPAYGRTSPGPLRGSESSGTVCITQRNAEEIWRRSEDSASDHSTPVSDPGAPESPRFPHRITSVTEGPRTSLSPPQESFNNEETQQYPPASPDLSAPDNAHGDALYLSPPTNEGAVAPNFTEVSSIPTELVQEDDCSHPGASFAELNGSEGVRDVVWSLQDEEGLVRSLRPPGDTEGSAPVVVGQSLPASETVNQLEMPQSRSPSLPMMPPETTSKFVTAPHDHMCDRGDLDEQDSPIHNAEAMILSPPPETEIANCDAGTWPQDAQLRDQTYDSKRSSHTDPSPEQRNVQELFESDFRSEDDIISQEWLDKTVPGHCNSKSDPTEDGMEDAGEVRTLEEQITEHMQVSAHCSSNLEPSEGYQPEDGNEDTEEVYTQGEQKTDLMELWPHPSNLDLSNDCQAEDRMEDAEEIDAQGEQNTEPMQISTHCSGNSDPNIDYPTGHGMEDEEEIDCPEKQNTTLIQTSTQVTGTASYQPATHESDTTPPTNATTMTRGGFIFVLDSETWTVRRISDMDLMDEARELSRAGQILFALPRIQVKPRLYTVSPETCRCVLRGGFWPWLIIRKRSSTHGVESEYVAKVLDYIIAHTLQQDVPARKRNLILDREDRNKNEKVLKKLKLLEKDEE